MPDTKPAPKQTGADNFLAKQVGPFQVWVWGIVILGGLAVGYIFWKKQQSATSATSTNSSSDASGLGLAVDPTNGYPYAVQGLVPSGGTAGGSTGQDYAYLLNQLQQEVTALQNPPPANTTTSSGTTSGSTPTPPTPPPPATPAVSQPATPPGAVSYASNVNTQFNQAGEVIPAGGKTYVGNGNPNVHLWNIAIQEYGVQGSAVNSATQAIINANPQLAGYSYTSVLPVGMRITIPQLPQ